MVFTHSPPFSAAALAGLLDLDRDPLLEGGVRLRDLERDLDLDLEWDLALGFLLLGELDLERE